MSRIAAAFWNPIVAKEYRSRMRSWRSPVALSVYILLLGLLGWALFSSQASEARNSFNSGQAAYYGRHLFLYLILFQMALICFVTPALTAGAISGERERQTIDLLFVTRIPPFSIVWGKLLASMSFVLLLLLVSVPIFSLVFLFGGIELDQVLAAFLVTLVGALTLGIIGIAFSSMLPRTLASTVGAYGTGFILVAATYLMGIVFPTTVDATTKEPPAPPTITYLSPVEALRSIADGSLNGYGVRYANGAADSSAGACSNVNGVTQCYAVPVGTGKLSLLQAPAQATNATIPSGLFKGWQFWQATVAMQLALCVIALAISSYLLPPIRRRPTMRKAARTRKANEPA
jgi:ABC-type transport system involved in multi-copper enzyme maturation permease subunit